MTELISTRPAGRGPRSGAATADRRAGILAAAARRFAASGYEATTVRQIADDVSLLSGSLYHHFATKEAMLHEIVRATSCRMRDAAEHIARAEPDAESRLVGLIVFDLREMLTAQTVHAILYNERKLFRRSAEFAYVLDAKRSAYAAWRRVLEEGIAAGLFNPGIDLFLVIQTVVRMLNTAADWYRNDDDTQAGPASTYSLDRVVDFHLAFVLNAVRAKGRVWDTIPRVAGEALAEEARIAAAG